MPENIAQTVLFFIRRLLQSLVTTISTLYCSITMKHKIEIGEVFPLYQHRITFFWVLKKVFTDIKRFFTSSERRIIENVT